MKNENTTRLPEAENKQTGSGGRPSTICCASWIKTPSHASLKTPLFKITLVNCPDEGWAVWNPMFMAEKCPGVFATFEDAAAKAELEAVAALTACLEVFQHNKEITHP